MCPTTKLCHLLWLWGAGSAGEVGPLEEEKVKQQKEAEVLLDPSLVQKYRRPEKHATEEKVAQNDLRELSGFAHIFTLWRWPW